MQLPELLKEFGKKRSEVARLRAQLNKINSVKEKFYKEKREVSQTIADNINRIKPIVSEFFHNFSTFLH